MGSVRITHIVRNGNIVGFTPCQGSCQPCATISLCELGKLLPGVSLTLGVRVKAQQNPLRQQVSVSSGGEADPQPDNNSVSVKTPVTPQAVHGATKPGWAAPAAARMQAAPLAA